MTNSMRGCVAYNDLWPWPISSRSFGLDLENRVRSVASTVLDGFFPYLVQMINSMRGCVAYNDLWPWHTSSRSFSHDFAKIWHFLFYMGFVGYGCCGDWWWRGVYLDRWRSRHSSLKQTWETRKYMHDLKNTDGILDLKSQTYSFETLHYVNVVDGHGIATI